MGDECVTFNFPESLKVSTQNNCPSGYKQIHKKADCTPNKDSFCCSFLHSGMMGDCEDVVINNINKECAFVLDINECIKLPDDWHRAEEKETWGRVCPSLEYTWKDEFLACSTKSILPQWIKLFGLLTFLIVIFLGATRFKKFRNK